MQKKIRDNNLSVKSMESKTHGKQRGSWLPVSHRQHPVTCEIAGELINQQEKQLKGLTFESMRCRSVKYSPWSQLATTACLATIKQCNQIIA